MTLDQAIEKMFDDESLLAGVEDWQRSAILNGFVVYLQDCDHYRNTVSLDKEFKRVARMLEAGSEHESE